MKSPSVQTQNIEMVFQRMIAAIEANTLAVQSLTRALHEGPTGGSEPGTLVSVSKAAKALGVSGWVIRKKVFSGEWPSEGEGRNRRVSVAGLRKIRQEEATVHLQGLAQGF